MSTMTPFFAIFKSNAGRDKIRPIAWTARVLLAPLCLLFLVGCADLLPKQATVPLVTLRMETPQIAYFDKPLPAQLLVGFPDAVNSLKTDRIALLFDNREVKYLADARWDNAAPALIQRQLVSYLSASGAFEGVDTDSSGLISRYRLRSDLDRLHLLYKQGDDVPTAEVSLTLTLIDIEKGLQISRKYISQREKAKDASLNSLLDALDLAVRRAMLDSSRWSADSMRDYLDKSAQDKNAKKPAK